MTFSEESDHNMHSKTIKWSQVKEARNVGLGKTDPLDLFLLNNLKKKSCWLWVTLENAPNFSFGFCKLFHVIALLQGQWLSTTLGLPLEFQRAVWERRLLLFISKSTAFLFEFLPKCVFFCFVLFSQYLNFGFGKLYSHAFFQKTTLIPCLYANLIFWLWN